MLHHRARVYKFNIMFVNANMVLLLYVMVVCQAVSRSPSLCRLHSWPTVNGVVEQTVLYRVVQHTV